MAVSAGASLFLFMQDRDFARDLMRRGVVLEPMVAHWHQSLGYLCMMDWFDAQNDEDRLRSAREGLAEYERALELTSDPAQQFGLLVDLVRVASMAGQHERSTELAGRILAIASEPGEPPPRLLDYGVHRAHAALGHAALAKGDVSTARAQLRAAGAVQMRFAGPEILGPDLTLAAATVRDIGEINRMIRRRAAAGSRRPRA